MTPEEHVQTLRIVRQLRSATGETALVVRLEREAARQLYLDLEPGEPNSGALIGIFPRVAERQVAQAVLLGIILGRAGDGSGNTWRLAL